MVNVPANGGQDWDLYTKKYRQAILDKLSRLLNTDIELLIEAESVLDPRMIESETASYMGSLYGNRFHYPVEKKSQQGSVNNHGKRCDPFR